MGRAQVITEQVHRVLARITAAAQAANRDPAAIQLLAVTKTFPVADLRAALLAGQRRFGESYLNEALPKLAALTDPAPEWHFIGPLQSNKTRAIAEQFTWVHSLASLKHAERLNEQRPVSMPPLNVCLQVNISGEASKSGVSLEALPALAASVAALPRLRLRGLMAIPAPSNEPNAQRTAFRAVRQALEALRAQGLALDTLSMGMTDDLESAIAEGATIVRVGSAIFGARES